MSVTGPAGIRYSPWIRVVGGLLLAAFVVVESLRFFNLEGPFRMGSPVLADALTAVLSFLVFLFMGAVAVPSGRAWVPWLTLGLAGLVSWTGAGTAANWDWVRDPDGVPTIRWWMVASGPVGAVLGFFLARRRPFPSHADAGEASTR